MGPSTIPLLQAGFGALQALGGALIRPRRPRYKIPAAVRENVARSRNLASATVRPGHNESVASIDRAANESLQGAKASSNSANQILNFAGKINAQKLLALGQNSAMNDQFTYEARRNLQDQLQNLATHQRAAFDYNQNQVYEDRARLKSSLFSAGLGNLWNAANSANFMRLYGNLYQK